MARLEIGKHLGVDTRRCGGRLTFKGTRIMQSNSHGEDIRPKPLPISTTESSRSKL